MVVAERLPSLETGRATGSTDAAPAPTDRRSQSSMALAHLGRLQEAREAVRAGLELNPGFTIARFRSSTFSDNPVYLAGRERMYEGLRKAGVPEE